MDEKRENKRVNADAIKIYKIQESSEHFGERASIGIPVNVDISAGGLQVLTKKSLEIGTPLDIILSVFPTKTPIGIQGEVVRCEPAGQGSQFKVGIKFTNYSDDIKKKLIENYTEQKN